MGIGGYEVGVAGACVRAIGSAGCGHVLGSGSAGRLKREVAGGINGGQVCHL